MEGGYRPTCPQALIPPDVVEAIQEQAVDHVKAGDLPTAQALLEKLNGWLDDSGQLRVYGVDAEAFLTAAQESILPDATPESRP
jgi:hypothetical protein